MPVCSLVWRYRDTAAVRLAARKVRRFVECYENANPDLATNGEAALLERLAGSGLRVVFDVGANVGDWARTARASLPEAMVHCFELVGETHRTLARNVSSDPRIVANPFGLSDREGAVAYNYYPANSTLATVTDFPHAGERQIGEGRVVAGDAYMREHGIARVDFLKLDVEGAEDRVLAGFGEALRRRAITAIQFEYGQVNILTRFLLRDFYHLLEPLGFTIGKIYPDRVDFRDYALEHENFLLSNYLAVAHERDDLRRRAAAGRTG